ncbi:hypothetical protein [Pseudomonas syringae]|nr:hypothetical protein [Pseudomonas syringae]
MTDRQLEKLKPVLFELLSEQLLDSCLMPRWGADFGEVSNLHL